MVNRLPDLDLDLVRCSVSVVEAVGFIQASKVLHLTQLQAENSQIDPKKDPLPLVMFGPQCWFRPHCLDALQRVGRTWEFVYDGGSILAIQSAVEADLGFSVFTLISLKPEIKIVEKEAGLPPLRTLDLALYYRKNLTSSAVQKLADFIAEQVARLEIESRQSLVRYWRNGAKGPALAAA